MLRDNKNYTKYIHCQLACFYKKIESKQKA